MVWVQQVYLRDIPVKLNSEFEIIRKYLSDIGTSYNKSNGIKLGVGDDCFIINHNKELLISSDTSVVGRHFPRTLNPCYIAYRSCSSALSDLAAMGAKPIAFSLTISVPQSNQKFFRGFKKGLRDFSQDYCIGLIGGDLVKGQLQISVTVYGVPEKNILLRSGARLGDLVYLSGPLGQGYMGLKRYKKSRALNKTTRHYLKPEAQIEYGLLISDYASSATDISDGLIQDLMNICKNSGVGFNLDDTVLPIASGLSKKQALTCGDDYQLIYTVPKKNIQLIDKLLNKKGLNFYNIGEITKSGYKINNKLVSNFQGYNHFT